VGWAGKEMICYKLQAQTLPEVAYQETLYASKKKLKLVRENSSKQIYFGYWAYMLSFITSEICLAKQSLSIKCCQVGAIGPL